MHLLPERSKERSAAVPAAAEPLQAEGCASETAAPLPHSHSQSSPTFKPLKKEAPIERTRRFLPHWEQEEWLNAGHGSCALKQPALRDIIAASFRHYDGQRYHMGDYVIMPNHVHALVTPMPGSTHREIVAAWKRYTGHEILKLTRGEAPFWLEEKFDHIVRSPQQLAWYRRYIRENPEKAFLKPGQWTHWEYPLSTAKLCALPESGYYVQGVGEVSGKTARGSAGTPGTATSTIPLTISGSSLLRKASRSAGIAWK